MAQYTIVRTDSRLVKGCLQHKERVMTRLRLPDTDTSIVGACMRDMGLAIDIARGYCRNERRSFYISLVDDAGHNIWGCDVEGTHD